MYPDVANYATMPITLFVARDKRHPTRHDLGSLLCLRVCQLLPEGMVEVQECANLAQRPVWLIGTPTLFTDDGQVFRGHAALDFVERLSIDVAREEGAASAAAQVTQAGKKKNAPPVRAAASRAEDGSTDDFSALPASEGDLWAPPTEYESDEEDTGSRKLKQEDFDNAMRERQKHSMGTGEAMAARPTYA